MLAVESIEIIFCILIIFRNDGTTNLPIMFYVTLYNKFVLPTLEFHVFDELSILPGELLRIE